MHFKDADWHQEGWGATDAKLLNAQQWITLAGAPLCKHLRSGKKLYGPSTRGTLWREKNGSEGFSMERWNFWADRFEAIGELKELSERTRQFSTQAAWNMRVHEREEAEKKRAAAKVAEAKNSESDKRKRKDGPSSNQPKDGPKRGRGRPRKEKPSSAVALVASDRDTAPLASQAPPARPGGPPYHPDPGARKRNSIVIE